jgi:hypothetical protein
MAKSTPSQDVSPKKTLKTLFDKRDQSCTGSGEEYKAAERILKALFPDTNSD